MSARQWTRRVICATKGCTESATYFYDRKYELTEALRREAGRSWYCSRHSEPDAVLAPDRRVTAVTLVALPSDRAPGLYWTAGDGKRGSGFTFGPGFKAWADDFPEGAELVITAEVRLPAAAAHVTFGEADTIALPCEDGAA